MAGTTCIGALLYATAAVSGGKVPLTLEHYGVMSVEERDACAAAYAALPIELRDQLQTAGSELTRRGKQELKAYDRACLRHWNSLRPQTRTVVGDIAGALFHRSKHGMALQCAAFRISEQFVVTAAHCLLDGLTELDPTAFEFRLFSKPLKKFLPKRASFAEENPTEDKLTDANDYVILEVDTSSAPFRQKQTLFRPELPYQEYLVIPAVSMFSHDSSTLTSTNWFEAVRVDKGRSCFRHRIDKGGESTSHCIFTRCQTSRAMSGAPIFIYDANQRTVYVGGMHIRSGLRPYPPSSSQRECDAHQDFNVGITLSPRIIEVAGQSRSSNR